MHRRRPFHYVTRARRTSGLTQAELGQLLGYSESFVQKCELGERLATLRFVMGCALIFGRSAVELFPGAMAALEEEIGRNAASFDETLRGKTDRRSLKKQALLSDIVRRTAETEL